MGKEKGRIVWLERKSLKRVLGVRDLFGIGYGDLGSSIYYALGATALFALGATPLALMLAGFVFVCTSFTYAELASTFPEPGGSATYTRYAFNDLISFIAGWGLLLDYIVTMAISAFIIPPYLNVFVTLFGVLPKSFSMTVHIGLALLILMVLFVINLIGVRHSGRVNFVLALLTALSQLIVVGIGFYLLLNWSHVWNQLEIGVANVDWSPTWPQFFKGVAMAMVAYTGIEAISQLAGETKNPSVAIPRSIHLTVLALLLMYFGISVVGMSVISPQELGTTYLEDPIAGIVSKFPGGAVLAPCFGLIAAVILFIASNAGLIGCSRLSFSMGEYYQVPAAFYRVHSKFRTPYVSLAVFTVFGCVVVVMSRGEMLFLADLYNIGAQLAFFSAHMALLVLRVKKPELSRPYRAPLNIPIGKGRSLPVTAMIGAVANLTVLVLILVTKPQGRYVAMGWMAIGLFMYWYCRRKRNLGITGHVEIQKVSIPEYAPIHYKNILVAVKADEKMDAFQTACQLAKLHGAKLTAVYIMEVPNAFPIHAQMQDREALGEEALKRAQAVAGEYHVPLQVELFRSRSMETTLRHLVETERYDLIVLGIGEKQRKDSGEIVSQSLCPVLLVSS
ncbi:MAG TPA: universal stress protein [Chlamydiales bacterium]|jgi:APA family basic amino acid/polyamine antiporter|nr:universal stress protein [Chlamydiales bacterium]